MFTELLLFFLSIIFLLFLPGYFLLLAIFKKDIKKYFSPLEMTVVAFATSLVIYNFLIIFFNQIGFSINRISILTIISLFILICWGLFKFSQNKKEVAPVKKSTFLEFNANQSILIILILFLTIFIKTVYLTDTIFPTSTDLGHHMYWSKLVSDSGNIPVYQKNEIVPFENDSYQLENNPIADFIIGEHLIFSGINILTRIPFVSYFPTLILFIINIFSLLALFILSLRIFNSNLIKNVFSQKNINPINLSVITLFLAGPIYALASPQAKFVSGGVIGNLIGNLLIPLCLYFYFRALREKNSWMLFLGLLLSAGLFYTHHLSGFIFIFIIIFSLFVFGILLILKNIQINKSLKIKSILANFKSIFKDSLSLFLKPQIIIFLIATLLFLFFIYTPNYLSTNAQSTVVGAPSKATRAGLGLAEFKYAVGEMRLTLGIIGTLFLLILVYLKKNSALEKTLNYSYLLIPSILIGWALSLSLMTLRPQWLHINIPSDRVANYANFPFLLLGALGAVAILIVLENLTKRLLISQKINNFLLILLFSTIVFLGFYDNNNSLSLNKKNQDALLTFHVSDFLAQHISTDTNLKSANILKDHNYISSDAWMKLFFMQDYSYPLSRGFFKRYEDVTKPREMCTLWMISEPSSLRAQSCARGTQTKYVIIKTAADEPQFKANFNFSKIYESDNLSVFSNSDIAN